MEIEYIEELYANKTIAELHDIATYKVRGLRPEAINILKEEICKRGMDEKLLLAIDSQSRTLTDEEFASHAQRIKNTACTNCKRKNGQLMGGYITKVRGLILFSFYEKTPKILCATCLMEKQRKAWYLNLVFGWWAITWNIVRNIGAILKPLFDNDEKRHRDSTGIIIRFIEENVANIELNRTESELEAFIKHWNRDDL
jgi:hypothetical protein